MGVTEELCDMVSQGILEVELLKGIVGNLEESLSRPGHEIDDCCVVDETWVHTTVVPEVVPCLAHQKYDVKVVLDSGVKLSHKHLVLDVLLLPLLAGLTVHPGHHLLHFLLYRWEIFLPEEVGNLPNSQNGVYILNKGLLSDLVVGEHKDRSSIVLESTLLRPLLYFLPEFLQLESLGHGHLAQVVLGYEGCQLGEGVSARASLSHQHAVAPLEFDNSVDFADVGDGHLEEGDIHGSRLELLVKLDQLLLDDLLELLPLLLYDLDVDLPVLALVKEVNKNGIMFLVVSALLHVGLEGLLQLLPYQFLELLPVLLTDKSIVEYPQALVHP